MKAGLRQGELKAEQLDLTGSLFGGVIITATSGNFTRVTDVNGVLFSVSAGSPGAFGAIVQAGSLGTDAGSAGFLALRQAFAGAGYFISLTASSGTSTFAFASGVKNATSGVNVVGGASGRYDWIAVGI